MLCKITVKVIERNEPIPMFKLTLNKVNGKNETLKKLEKLKIVNLLSINPSNNKKHSENADTSTSVTFDLQL